MVCDSDDGDDGGLRRRGILKMTTEIVGQTINGKTGTTSIFSVLDNCSATTNWVNKDTDGTTSAGSGQLSIAVSITGVSQSKVQSSYLNTNLKNAGAYIVPVAATGTAAVTGTNNPQVNGYLEVHVTDGASNTVSLLSLKVNMCDHNSGGSNSNGAGGGEAFVYFVFKSGQVQGTIYSAAAYSYQRSGVYNHTETAGTVTSISQDVSSWNNVYILIRSYMTSAAGASSTATGTTTVTVPYVIKLDNFQDNILSAL